jgi:hypothetical protein
MEALDLKVMAARWESCGRIDVRNAGNLGLAVTERWRICTMSSVRSARKA